MQKSGPILLDIRFNNKNAGPVKKARKREIFAQPARCKISIRKRDEQERGSTACSPTPNTNLMNAISQKLH